MKKTVKKGPKRTAPTTGALLPLLHAIVRRDLREFVVDAGMTALADVLEQERAAACGPRYAHQPGRRAFRAGHAMGELVLGGRRVQAKRPRARTVDGEEVTLPSWHAFSSEDPLHERDLPGRSTPSIEFRHTMGILWHQARQAISHGMAIS